MTNDETSSNDRMTNARRKRFSLFGFRDSFGIRRWSFVISLAGALSSYAAPAPSAQEILASVRTLESRQQIDLDGQLRQDDIVVPFHINQDGPVIRYSFTDPNEVVELRLSENSSRLELATDSGSEKFPAEKLDEK